MQAIAPATALAFITTLLYSKILPAADWSLRASATRGEARLSPGPACMANIYSCIVE